jgi:hypothetical protein
MIWKTYFFSNQVSRIIRIGIVQNEKKNDYAKNRLACLSCMLYANFSSYLLINVFSRKIFTVV